MNSMGIMPQRIRFPHERESSCEIIFSKRKPFQQMNSKSSHSIWFSIILPVMVGGLLSSFFFGPYVEHNATPAPYVVAFGFGGIASLLIAIVLRFFWNRKK